MTKLICVTFMMVECIYDESMLASFHVFITKGIQDVIRKFYDGLIFDIFFIFLEINLFF
jgi:hypothetical protein